MTSTITFYDKNLHHFSIHLKRLGYSKATQYTLNSYTKEFLEHLSMQGITKIAGITSEHISTHYHYLTQRPNQRRSGGLSSSTISQHIGAIRLFLCFHQQIGEIKENPISGMVFAGVYHQPRVILTSEEITQLYRACETLRDRAILALFYGCGLRRSEAERLNIKDVKFKERFLYVREGKGRKRRVIPMSQQVAQDLRNYYYHERSSYITRKNEYDPQAFVLNKWGGRMLGERYYSRLKELIQRTGNQELITSSIGLHNLRHSIATHLLESGVSVEQVRDFLGHDNLETTQIYTRLNHKQMQNLNSEHRTLNFKHET